MINHIAAAALILMAVFLAAGSGVQHGPPNPLLGASARKYDRAAGIMAGMAVALGLIAGLLL